MNETVTRTTKRWLRELPDAVTALRFEKQYSSNGKRFRPRSITETLEQPSRNYQVKVSGPVIKKDGGDSEAESGELTWTVTGGGQWSSSLNLADLPDEIKALLIGREGLAEWTKP